jgi:hypothetical protein
MPAFSIKSASLHLRTTTANVTIPRDAVLLVAA